LFGVSWTGPCRDGVVVGRVELRRLLVIGNSKLPVAIVHVSFGDAVVNDAGSGMGFDVELEDTNSIFELSVAEVVRGPLEKVVDLL
jgi:hypothetical protein